MDGLGLRPRRTALIASDLGQARLADDRSSDSIRPHMLFCDCDDFRWWRSASAAGLVEVGPALCNAWSTGMRSQRLAGCRRRKRNAGHRIEAFPGRRPSGRRAAPFRRHIGCSTIARSPRRQAAARGTSTTWLSFHRRATAPIRLAFTLKSLPSIFGHFRSGVPISATRSSTSSNQQGLADRRHFPGDVEIARRRVRRAGKVR